MTTTPARVRSGRLGRAERRFLRRLQALLVVFPRDERRRMLATVRQNLEDRPTAGSWDQLILELGTPEAYARQLVHDERALPQPALWRRVAARFPNPWLAGAASLLVVALVAGALAYRDWYGHRPSLSDSCYGIESDEDVPIDLGQALGYREQRVDYVDGAAVRLTACVYSSETIEVLHVGFPVLEDHGPVELIEVTMVPLVAYQGERPTPVPAAAYTLGGDGDSEREDEPRLVTHHLRFAGCARALGTDSNGAYFNVPPPEITYRYRGRTHVELLELDTRIFLSIDRADCPDAAPLSQTAAAGTTDGG